MAELNVESVEALDDGKILKLVVHLRNDTAQTLHLHAMVRGIHYDPATRELRFQLTDRPLMSSVPRSWYVMPKLVTIDPHSRGKLELKQSRFLTRLAPGSDPQMPKVEQLKVYEATSVAVEVAWSDKPFYGDPRSKQRKSMPEQMVAWEKGLAAGRSERRPEAPPPEQDPSPGDSGKRRPKKAS